MTDQRCVHRRGTWRCKAHATTDDGLCADHIRERRRARALIRLVHSDDSNAAIAAHTSLDVATVAELRQRLRREWRATE